MKQLLRMLGAALLLGYASTVWGGGDLAGRLVSTTDAGYVPGEVLVVPKQSSAIQGAAVAGLTVIQEQKQGTPFLRVKLPEGSDVMASVQALANEPWVAHVQPNYIYKINAVPNDTDFSKYWGFRNTGQTVNGTAGISGADISMTGAWDQVTDCSAITVAVIDTGVAYDHPDLSTNIWSNAGEIPGNATDDDLNGYVDDVRGWDFEQGDNDPMDYHYHGTHVAGTIGAIGNNATGGTGVCWNVKIMPIRALGTTGSGTTATIAAAVGYAVANNAKVINMSLGSSLNDPLLSTAIDTANTNNVLVVAAAGNGGSDGIGDDNDTTPQYPASYTQTNIIAVAATDQNDALATFSNYGATSVDVAAPGVNVYSHSPPARQTVATYNFDTGLQGWTGSTIDTGTGRPVANTVATTAAWSFSAPNSLTDTPAGNYANSRRYLAVSPAINLAGKNGVKVDSKLWLSTESGFDYLYTESSTDGATWTNLGGISGTTTLWYSGEADLKTLDGAAAGQIRMRFETNATTVGDGIYVDDVVVSAAGTAYAGTEYQYLQGTSMATPHVAGLAALIWAGEPALTMAQVRDRILNTGDLLAALAGKSTTGKRINAQMAMKLVAPTALSATVASSTRVNLSWTDNSVSEKTFRIQRSTDGVSYTTVGTVSANTTTFSDTSPPSGSLTYYTIAAVGADGSVSSTAAATVTTPAAPAASGGGGGGCVLNPQAGFDPTMVLLLASGLFLLRRRV